MRNAILAFSASRVARLKRFEVGQVGNAGDTGKAHGIQREALCSVFAGYAWDTENPFIRDVHAGLI